MQRVAVVIPEHKEQLNELEQISMTQCRKVLGHYPIIYCVPEGKNLAWIPEGSRVIHMPHLGQGIDHYNMLMKSPQFYEPFLDYEYILIYHTDAFVFYDALEYFCSLGYDYIGAPWPIWFPWLKRRSRKNISRVGNGGFCLRKVRACYNLLTNHPELIKRPGNEDTVFSCFGKIPELNFHVAPYNIAYQFAMEVNPPRVIKKNGGHFPFGCHKWFGYNADVLIDFFLKLGYDLRPFRNRLRTQDFAATTVRQGLINEAVNRLIRKVNGKGGIIWYLPTKRFASIRVLENPNVLKLLERLDLKAEVLSYDDTPALVKSLTAEEPQHSLLNTNDMNPLLNLSCEDIHSLTNDLTIEKLPHLILTIEDDTALLAELEKHGLRYGEHVISFRKEYLKYCEKLFHNLGK